MAKRITTRKKKYTCNNGPLKGHSIWLSTPWNLRINIGGKIGRYIPTPNSSDCLIWEYTAVDKECFPL
jgi:hypothetical protein